jgi:UDP-3-O-[3-hydroxymyristoyl] glucosamine N-acyltransferase
VRRTLGEIARSLGGTLGGPEELEVDRVAHPSACGSGAICVWFAEGAPPELPEGAACVVGEDAAPPNGPHIRVPTPKSALAELLRLLHPEAPPEPGVHPTAVVSAAAEIGADVHIGAHTVIGAASIGARCIVGAQSYLGDGVTIGEDTRLFPRVTVLDGCTIGARVRIHSGTIIGADGFGYEPGPEGLVKVPQVGTVVVEDDVELGASVAIDRATLPGTATVVGRGTKVDNLVQVGHNVRVGQMAVICGLAGLAGSCTIGDGAVVGGAVGIRDHIEIGAGARIGGKAAVTRSVLPGEDVMGHPARPVQEHLRIQAALSRLPEVLRRLRALEKAAGGTDDPQA